MANGASAPIPTPQFPTHNAPRVWLLTSGDSPIGISVAKQVLDHGDYVVSGIIQADFEDESVRSEEFKNFLSEVVRTNGWKDRLKIVPLDIRYGDSIVTPFSVQPLFMHESRWKTSLTL